MQSGKSGRVRRIAVLCGAALMLAAGLGRGPGVVRAQKSQDPLQQKSDDPFSPSASPGAHQPGDIPDAMGPMRERIDENRMKAMNDSRHKRLEDDATKLQELSNELKSDVDKANKDELSIEVMRKAAEIEKLAHDVQNHMKN